MTRTALLLTTALTLAGASTRAVAQVAPTQLPVGPTVVAGSAGAVVNGSSLTVTQGSTRAAIDWRSFDVGRNASVRFATPGSSAITLNRVTGPAGTTIAGHVSSNGQLMIVNQSGVLVTSSGAIDAQSVVLSAAGISQAGMRAGVATGHFALDQAARPGAAVENRGRISVRAAGLAALVAPTVANSGTIAAPFGTVQLAGETAQVVDLYGDGLLSMDVSRQTVQVATASGKTPALVTNDGVIVAEGGRVVLSTAAVDGVVTNLVTAGGSISVDSGAGPGGSIAIGAAGGSAHVTGRLSARGSVGGTVAVIATEDVVLHPSARIDVGGVSGGGVAAIGTTVARATGGAVVAAPRAKRVVVASGAGIAADARAAGKGGTIVLLSAEQTRMAGSLSARGGAAGGDGGLIEVSGDHVLSLTGSVDAGAWHGRDGSLLLDPGSLTVASGGTAGSGTVVSPGTVSGASLAAVNANVTLTATDTLTIDDNIALTSHHALVLNGTTITLTAGHSVANNAAISFTATGGISLFGSVTSTGSAANGDGLVAFSTAGVMTVNGSSSVTTVVSGPTVTIGGGGTLAIGSAGSIDAAVLLDLNVGRATQAGGVTTGLLTSSLGSSGTIDLLTATNHIVQLGTFAVTGAGSALRVGSAGSMAVAGALSAAEVALSADTLGLGANVTATASLALNSVHGIVQSGGSLTTPRLVISGSTGDVALTQANQVTALGAVTITGGSFALTNARQLTVTRPVSVANDRTIALAVRSLAVTSGEGGGGLTGGTVELAPDSAGAMTLGGTNSATALVATQANLDSVTATTLRLGRAGGATTASTLTSAGAVDVTAFATTELHSGGGGTTLSTPVTANVLGLASAGSIDGSAAIVRATRVQGAGALGRVVLSNAANTIGVLGTMTLSGALSLTTAGTLAVAGPVSLSGNGTIRLESSDSLVLGAGAGFAIDAPSGTLDVITDGTAGGRGGGLTSVTQTAAIDVGELDGAVSGPVTLAAATNTIGTTGALSAQGALRLRTTGTLTVKGALGASGVTVDLTAAALAEGADGVVTGDTLTSAGGVAGAVRLDGANAVGTLTAFTADTLLLADAGNLVVGSGVAASSATLLSGGTLSFAAPIGLAATGTLDLQAAALEVRAGASGEIAGGAFRLLEIAPLAGRSLSLGGSTNAGNLAVPVGLPLRAGTLQLGAFGSSAAIATAIDLGAFDYGSTGPGRLQVVASGDVTQSGSFTVGSLGGRVGGDLALTEAGNAIGHFGGLVLAGDGTIVDGAALTIDGAVSLAAAHTLALAAAGLAFDAGGTIQATGGTVAIGRASDGGTLDWGGAGGIAADLDAITAATLRIGRFGANRVATLNLLGADRATGAATLELAAGTAITEAGTASLAANTLILNNSTLDVVLVGNSLNAIGTLGDTTLDALTLQVAGSLTVAGTVSLAGGNLRLLGQAIDIAGGGSIDAAGAAAQFQASRFLNAGQVAAATIEVAPLAGGGTLSVSGLGSFSTTTVRFGTITGSGVLAGSIDFPAAFSVGAATLDLNASGRISQATGAVLTAERLTGSAGTVALADAVNAIPTLGAFTVTGSDFAFAAGPTLSVAGPVSLPSGHVTLQSDRVALGDSTITASTLSVVPLLAGGTLSVSGTLGAVTLAELGGASGVAASGSVGLGNLAMTSGTLALLSSGSVSQAGSLSLGSATLTGSAAALTLAAAANSIARLGALSANSGDLVLVTTAPLSVRGRVHAHRLLAITDSSTLSATAIQIGTSGLSGTLDAGDVGQLGTVALTKTATNFSPNTAIQESSNGAIRTDVLTIGSARGDVFTVLGHNTIATLGAVIVSNGAFSLTDTVSLDVAGTVSASFVRLASTAAVGTGDAITQQATGTLVTDRLVVLSDEGNIRLDRAANRVGTAEQLEAPGTVALADQLALTVSADITGSTVRLRVAGLDVRPGTTIGGGGTVEVAPFAAGTLGVGDGAPGALVTSAALAAMQASTLRLGAVGGTTLATDLVLAGGVAPPVGVLDLRASGSITQTGSLDLGTGTLTGAADAVTLDGDNTLGVLAGFTTAHGFLLHDTTGLDVSGDVTAASGGVSLALGGALTLSADSLVALAGTVDLTADGASQQGGTIRAATLASSGSPTGDFVLTGANAVGTLGPWQQTAGSLSLTSTGDGGGTLSVGRVRAPTLTLSAPTLALVGAVGGSGDSIALLGTTGIESGSLTAARLTGTLSGAATLTGSNTIAQLGGFQATRLALTNTSLLHIAGRVAVGSLDLSSAGVVIDSGGITATSLTGSGGSGTYDLIGGSSSIDTLGSFTVPLVTLKLTDQVGLAITGAVTAANLVLSAPTVAVQAAVAAGTVDLTATTGDVTQTAAIQATTLAASAVDGDVTLTNAANEVAASASLGALGTIALADSRALLLTGAVTAGTVRLQTTGLDASTGSITAGTLAEIVPLVAGRTLGLGGSGSDVTISAAALGAIHAPTLRLGSVATTAGIAIRGNIAPQVITLDLRTAGAVIEPAGRFAIGTGTLTGQAASVSLDAGNTLGVLGAFTGFDTSGFTLTDAAALTVPGTLTAASIALTADTLTLAGSLTAASVALTGTGTAGPVIVLAGSSAIRATTLALATPAASGVAVSQQVGALIVAGTLTVPLSTGTIDLTLGTDSIDVLGDVAGESLRLRDLTALTARGEATLSGTLGLEAAGLTLDAGGAIRASRLDLASSGTIAEAADFTLAADTLTATAAGDIALDGSLNAVAQLASIATSGSFALTDARTLDIGGAVGAGTVRLRVDGLTRSAGGISAGLVEIGPRAGVLGLGDGAPGSAVSSPALASITAGILRLGQVDGAILASDIVIAGAVAPLATQLGLRATGSIVESGGSILLPGGTLTGGAGTSVSLTGANQLGALGGFSAPAGFGLGVVGDLVVDDDITAANITLAATGQLTLGGTATPVTGRLTATGGTVDLTAAGLVQRPGAIVTAAVLQSSGTASGSFALTAANQIGTLGGFAAPALGLHLIDAGALAVAGPLQLATLTLDAPTLTLAGPIGVAGTVDLVAGAGGIRQTGGTLAAATLVGTAGGPVSLLRPGNAVLDLGGFTAPRFALANAAVLAITGTLSAGTVDLTAPGITEPGGSVLAHLLTSSGTSSGAVLLDGTNSIDLVAGITVLGDLVLHDSAALTLQGVVAPANLALVAPSVTLDGVLVTGTADLSTSVGGVRQTAAGSARIARLTSTGGIVGGLSLVGAGLVGTNTIATLGSLSVTGGDALVVAGGTTLAVAGTVSADNIRLTDAGFAIAIGEGGLLSAAGTVELRGVGITESGSGAIAAGTLAGAGLTFGGTTADVALAGANRIGTLRDFATAGGMTLADSQALTLAGSVAVARLALTAPTITLAGTVAGTLLDLIAAGGVTQTGGGVTETTLAGSVGGTLDLRAGANAVASLGSLTAQAILLTDQGDLALAGTVTATNLAQFALGGTLSETGTLATARLTGSAAAVALGGAGNAIASVGDVAATGGFALATGGDLALTGALRAASVALAAGGAITQPGGTIETPLLTARAASLALIQANRIDTLGDVTVPGALTLVNAIGLQLAGLIDPTVFDLTIRSGGAVQTGGTLTAGRLTSAGGIVGDLALAQPGNRIDAAGGLSVTGRFTLADAQDLALDGPIAAAVTDLSAPTITQTAGGISTGQLTSTGGIAGDLTLDGDNAVPDLGPLRVGGRITLRTGTGLRIAGPVLAANAALTVGGDLGFAADLSVPGTLSLTVAGQIVRSAGRLDMGLLTGIARSSADFGDGAGVATLGAFTVQDSGDVAGAAATSRLRLLDGVALTLAGPVAADYIRIGAVGALTWTGDLITLGLPRAQQGRVVPNELGTVLSVAPDANGRARIDQLGVVRVISQDGGLSTVRLDLPATGGAITLADVEAPATDLILFTGTGTATGRINVGDLLVSGRLGAVNLIGSVRGLVGQAAARDADITPLIDSHYRINNCPLQSVNCVLLPTAVLPLTNPLRDLSIGQARDDRDDPDILLPNVSDRDY